MRRILLAALLTLALPAAAPSPALARGPEAPQLDWQAVVPHLEAEIVGLRREVAELKAALAKLQRDYAHHVHGYTGPGGEERQTSGPIAGRAPGPGH